jgi:hypothetical protein
VPAPPPRHHLAANLNFGADPVGAFSALTAFNVTNSGASAVSLGIASRPRGRSRSSRTPAQRPCLPAPLRRGREVRRRSRRTGHGLARRARLRPAR